MGWGDTIESHKFVPMFWKAIENAIYAVDPGLGDSNNIM